MRIRSIKPEFWRSPDVAELPRELRLLWIGLWSYVDDNGVGLDDYRIIAAELFALDDPIEAREFVREGLATLSRGLRIVRYTLDGRSYLYVNGWDKHQRVDKPNKPRYPLPPDNPTPPPDNETPAQRSNEPDLPTPEEPHTRHPRETLANPPETLAPGTGEQGNRGTGESSAPPTYEKRAHARDKAAELSQQATNANTLQIVNQWQRDRGHHYTRSQLGNLARALHAQLEDGANPTHFPTTLDIHHTEGRGIGFIPHAYEAAIKRASAPAGLPARPELGAHGRSRPSTTDTRMAETQALRERMRADGTLDEIDRSNAQRGRLRALPAPTESEEAS